MRLRGAHDGGSHSSSCCRTAPRANKAKSTRFHTRSRAAASPRQTADTRSADTTHDHSFSPSTFTLKSWEMFGHVLANCSSSGCNAASAASWGSRLASRGDQRHTSSPDPGQLQRIDIRHVPGESRCRNPTILIVLGPVAAFFPSTSGLEKNCFCQNL